MIGAFSYPFCRWPRAGTSVPRRADWPWLAACFLVLLQIGQGQAADPPWLGRLELPAGFAIRVFAEVPDARSLAVADGGARIYVGTRGTEVFAALDPERDGVANEVLAVADGLNVPNGIAVAADGALLVVEQSRILRIEPSGASEEIMPPGVLPDDVFHGWRYARFGPDGLLYIAVGAPCNVCEIRGFEGTILRMRADGHDLQIFARGIRNSVGFDWHPRTDELFFTDNGGDFLGDSIPPDELNRAPKPDLHFGYPYQYGQGVPYPDFAGRDPPRPTTPPALEFEAHAAALGIAFYDGSMFPAAYRGDAFVAQHGSWNRTDPVGYRVMRVRFDERGRPVGKEPFIAGWLRKDGGVLGRPVDLAELPDGSLLISDDHAGLIYRVTHSGGDAPLAGQRSIPAGANRDRRR
jgi:glucose/arabinose dehydrogenase